MVILRAPESRQITKTTALDIYALQPAFTESFKKCSFRLDFMGWTAFESSKLRKYGECC
jgi:hypothetical protein